MLGGEDIWARSILAQTNGDSPWGFNTGPEAIFDTSPLSRDMGVGLDCPWGSKIMKIFFSIFLFFHFHWLDLVQARPEYTKLSHNSYPIGNN